ncbi:MAG: M48 family metallopeptidase [Rubrivivax sp.]|nr:M48 family metallopeptidase [Pyrinomonadaceae bacterium]
MPRRASPLVQHSVTFGQKTIRYGLRLSDRKTLGIDVHPDQSVTVTAPLGTSIEQVETKVRKRAAWILKQQAYFQNFLPAPSPRQYVSGETHLYLGRQYRLKVIEGVPESVKLKGGFIHVGGKNITPEQTAALLNDWLLAHAKAHFHKRLELCWEKFRRYGMPIPEVRIRKMAKRWGTCTIAGAIYLNPDLIKVSSYLIDYVITHELCHLKQADHSKAFYHLMRTVMPDWEQRKLRLERALR